MTQSIIESLFFLIAIIFIIYYTFIFIRSKEKFHKKLLKWIKEIIDALFGIG